MKLTVTFFLRAVCAAFLLVLTTSQATAQDSCTFRLRVYDDFGDGWDDSQVYIRMGSGAERGYTHGGTTINRADSTRFSISASEQETLSGFGTKLRVFIRTKSSTHFLTILV